MGEAVNGRWGEREKIDILRALRPRVSLLNPVETYDEIGNSCHSIFDAGMFDILSQ